MYLHKINEQIYIVKVIYSFVYSCSIFIPQIHIIYLCFTSICEFSILFLDTEKLIKNNIIKII